MYAALTRTLATIALLASPVLAAIDDRAATETRGQISGEVCKMAFGSEQAVDFTPPVALTSANPRLFSTSIKKPCSGMVMVEVVAWTQVQSDGGYLYVVAKATCTGSGGFSGACTVGTTKTATHGEVLVGHNMLVGSVIHDTAHYRGFFNNLGKGVWRIDIESRGDGTSIFTERTLTITAFKGGV